MIKNMLYTDAVNPIRLWSPLDVNALLDAKERLMCTVQTSVAKASLSVLLKILSVACIFVGITIGWYFLIGTLIYGPEVREGLELKIALNDYVSFELEDSTSNRAEMETCFHDVILINRTDDTFISRQSEDYCQGSPSRVPEMTEGKWDIIIENGQPSYSALDDYSILTIESNDLMMLHLYQRKTIPNFWLWVGGLSAVSMALLYPSTRRALMS